MKIREFGGFLKGSAVAAAAFVLSSCFETKQEFVLNPDGSGKVRHECAFQNVSLNGEAEPGEEALKEAVLQLLDKSKGVEAWKDVEFKYLDDGRIWFGGTAYFKDLNKLEIENQALLKFSWADGVLELDMEEGDGEEPSKKPGEVNLKAERAKYQQSRPMLAAMLGGMKHRVAFELPGKVEESSNFEKEDGGGLSIGFEGAKMLEVMDKLVADDEWLREQGFEAQEGPEFDNRMCGMLFGEEAPVRAKVGASKPLFDYVREVAAAKEGMAALMKSLGAPQPVAPRRAGGWRMSGWWDPAMWRS